MEENRRLQVAPANREFNNISVRAYMHAQAVVFHEKQEKQPLYT